MRRDVKFLLALFVVVLGWYAVWSWRVAGRVNEIKAVISNHNQQFKSATPTMVLKAEDVAGTGFPFSLNVKISEMQLSMIEGDETFLVRASGVVLKPIHEGYAVTFSPTLDALYAKNGSAPEHYTATLNNAPIITLRMAGKGPMAEYRAKFSGPLRLTMALDGETRSTDFTMPPDSAFHPIPADVKRPLWLFVSVLREALVFNTP